MGIESSDDPNRVVERVIGAPSQAVNLQQWESSSGSILAYMDKDGGLFPAAISDILYTTAYPTLTAAFEALPDSDPYWGNPGYEGFEWVGGGVIFHPVGTKIVAQSEAHIHFPSYTQLVGASRTNSIIDCSAWNTDDTVLFALQSWKKDYDTGASILRSGIRDLTLRGNFDKHTTAISAHQQRFGERHGGTYSGWCYADLARLELIDWGADGVYLNAREGIGITQGWIGCVHFDDCNWRGGGAHNGYRSAWDVRAVEFKNCYFEGEPGVGHFHTMNHGLYASSSMFVSLRDCVLEGLVWAAEFPGCVNVEIDHCYFEGDTYGLGIGSGARQVRATNCFWYGGAFPFEINDANSVLIENWECQDVDTGGNVGYYSGDIALCRVVDITMNAETPGSSFASITKEPDYIELPRTPTYIYPRIGRGKALPILVKPDTGAPTDAAYGSAVGLMVYNSFDKVMYVHGVDGADDWDVV